MRKDPLPRLDTAPEIHQKLLEFCRLKPGEIWCDPVKGHRVGCLDATDNQQINRLCEDSPAASLAIQDPPYNLVAFETRSVEEYIEWCRRWIDNSQAHLCENSSFYVWLGADQNNGFQPLPEFMLMMRQTSFASRSFITLRNQRGYGTQKNWMSVRQELLFYTLGNPFFTPQYTEIPKSLKGYYKEIDGTFRENLERGHSPNIRAGNVWFDVQQVFYRMKENVNGCYAQKPLRAIDRILQASSQPGDIVLDFFAHAGTTLLAAEMSERVCLTSDIDPVFCEITIRRLEQWRKNKLTGWQNSNPFSDDLLSSAETNSAEG
ncbi:MAG: site-specific DNA-methyltransferase [Chloroflexi bacterium]|uniref:Methyltransferase n=1 Tax=Candidatus Chlorohelix allophototropha TaxID=3003348 RepID=A0A8T7MAJ6_9CHLR|nr:site-specific DNA-methyltransferase [Chloroflexota bacterium]WJW68951.1 site-specific DNA-methyltransferase [Chloroflexota bacterium L227-S17]